MPRVEGETYDSVVKVQSWTDATLQFADETFDAVVLNVEDVADPAAALKESFRVLKKGGKVSFAAWADATPSALRLLIDATGASAADFFPLATEAAANEALVAAGFDGATFATASACVLLRRFSALAASAAVHCCRQRRRGEAR